MPLLVTKLFFPTPRRNLVIRPRLVEQLDSGLHGPLTLISAPAGSGKTSLMSEWQAGPGSKRLAAWLSLDSADNDPLRFLTYLTTALESASPSPLASIASQLQSPQPPPLNSLITSLLEALSKLSVDLILALDDYHVITNPFIHDVLKKILDYPPPGFHLVILTRADPPLPLARLRARNQLTEIRFADLRFTMDEVAAFLGTTMGLSLSQEQIASLEARTEGWIVGLQLAALSMQGRRDVEDFIAAFTGSHQYVVDYLVEEVINRQAEKTRDFLLKTSILERMNAPLCNAITNGSDGQSMLEELEQVNLFVVGLDDQRQWYRYHHLFADVLRKYLNTMSGQQVRELHRLASNWYTLNGYPADAFDHALQGDDCAQAIQIVEENSWSMVLHGELSILQRWIQSLPVEMIAQRPWLCVYNAWALLFSGESNTAEKYLQLAEACFSTDKATVMPIDMQGHSSAIRAWISYQNGDLRQAVMMSRQAIELVPGMDPAVRCLLAGILGQGCVAENDFTEAARHYSDMINWANASGNVMMEVAAQCALGWLSELMGRLREAKAIYQNAIQRANLYKSPSAGQAYLGLSNLYREWNDLVASKQNVEKAIELSRVWGHVDALASGYLYMARINHAQNDAASMNLNLGEMDNTIRGHVLEPPTLILLEAVRARLMLAQGNIESARHWARERGLTIDDHLDYFTEVEYLTLVQIFMAEKQLDRAAHLLGRLRDVVESSARYGNLIEILILQSLVFDKQGKLVEALAALQMALELAEPQDYMRIFLDLGTAVEKLLKQIKAENASLKNYINKLLAAFNGSSIDLPSPMSKSQLLIEPLSERELEVLRLTARGKSNQQIANELVLATGTVKKHLNNIFGKMNVQNRTECVVRARELNLL